METEQTTGPVGRPPLRKWTVRTVTAGMSPDRTPLVEDHEVTAHLVFDNSDRGQGLVFRRYYNDSVRTEKVAEFQDGTWQWYKEIE